LSGGEFNSVLFRVCVFVFACVMLIQSRSTMASLMTPTVATPMPSVSSTLQIGQFKSRSFSQLSNQSLKPFNYSKTTSTFCSCSLKWGVEGFYKVIVLNAEARGVLAGIESDLPRRLVWANVPHMYVCLCVYMHVCV